ncbi:hypothetical protein I4U23_011028 [Adineta vaga]|nr:hypothetical protein I4U23_011028 [Adineta vaga]
MSWQMNLLIGFIRLFIGLFIILMFIVAWDEFDKSNNYIKHQCQVNTVNAQYYTAIWSVIIMDNEGVWLRKSLALSKAKKYEVDQIYTCYGPP